MLNMSLNQMCALFCYKAILNKKNFVKILAS